MFLVSFLPADELSTGLDDDYFGAGVASGFAIVTFLCDDSSSFFFGVSLPLPFFSGEMTFRGVSLTPFSPKYYSLTLSS